MNFFFLVFLRRFLSKSASVPSQEGAAHDGLEASGAREAGAVCFLFCGAGPVASWPVALALAEQVGCSQVLAEQLSPWLLGEACSLLSAEQVDCSQAQGHCCSQCSRLGLYLAQP